MEVIKKMGQYYFIVNIEKKQYIHPHKMGSGLKLWEMLAEGSPFRALGILLADGNGRGGGDIEEHPLIGSWIGDTIIVAGDYADLGKFIDDKKQNLFNYAKDHFEDISVQLREILINEGIEIGERWDIKFNKEVNKK